MQNEENQMKGKPKLWLKIHSYFLLLNSQIGWPNLESNYSNMWGGKNNLLFQLFRLILSLSAAQVE